MLDQVLKPVFQWFLLWLFKQSSVLSLQIRRGCIVMPPNRRLVRPVYPKPRERGMGSKGRNGRHIPNFDNWVSIQVR